MFVFTLVLLANYVQQATNPCSQRLSGKYFEIVPSNLTAPLLRQQISLFFLNNVLDKVKYNSGLYFFIDKDNSISFITGIDTTGQKSKNKDKNIQITTQLEIKRTLTKIHAAETNGKCNSTLINGSEFISRIKEEVDALQKKLNVDGYLKSRDIKLEFDTIKIDDFDNGDKQIKTSINIENNTAGYEIIKTKFNIEELNIEDVNKNINENFVGSIKIKPAKKIKHIVFGVTILVSLVIGIILGIFTGNKVKEDDFEEVLSIQ